MNEDQEYTEILTKYRHCMAEVKHRTEAIRLFISKQRTTGYPYTDVEFVCLQFRKILELIALANLVSNRHEYAKKYKNFVNHYHAKHILRDIEKINPNFYPRPGKQVVTPGKITEVIPIKDGYLTKDEFVAMYDECSELAHAENPFMTPKDIEDLRSKFPLWLSKIITLLNHHQVQLLDRKKQIWCLMHAEGDGQVGVWLFEQIAGQNAGNDS